MPREALLELEKTLVRRRRADEIPPGPPFV